MPLVRFQVRNEYGLGQPQLYKEATKEDPKAVLNGVAVAGLVGILRQLGDLAEFAAEVFHGLQEHVTTTASRSHKLMVRIQQIEAALPPFEKAVLAQTSHIHFAYTAGIEWHPHIRNESHHFIYNDLPRFIMDSYEECSDPPRLHLLDKFDTGGPGSCLKRYSDPTFFKRASALPDEANIEKRQRERKVQRSKKKKGSQHNGDISRCASVSNRSSRMQPISYIVNGQSSPSPTASTTDMALKSDLGNHCNSFGSRTVSGYIEYVAHSGSSMQARQQEYKESCSSESVLHDDTLESVLPDGRSVFVDGNSPGSSLQDQVTSSSSCGKWDEKAEIVDPTGQQRCFIETIEILPAMNDMDSHEGGAGDIRSIEPKDFLFHDENILEPTLSRIPLDEFESEADAFMDALNTIESESEYDLDYQTKREVGNFPTFDDSKGRDAMHEITMDSSSPQTPRFEHTATTYISPERDMPVDQPNSASLESHFREQIPQLATVPSISNHPVGGDRIDVIDDSRLETENCDSTSSGSGNVNAQDKVVSSLCEPQDSPAEILSNNSINFWTNGGMLGLEPSKPPDFTMASPVNPASRSTGETFCLSNHAYKIIVDEHDMEPSMLTVDDRCNHKDQEDGISSENISEGVSPTEVSTKLGSIGDSCKSNRFGPAMDDGWRKIKTIAPGNAVPVAAYNKSTSNDLNQQNDESTSRVFGLGRRLLENGFGRSVPDAFDNNFKPVSYLDAGAFEQRNEPHRSFPGAAFRENSEDGFGVHSSPASPPLEHMKISFHPINGIETSKLQLKLSDGNQSHGSVRDMFQSFQLIPEPAIPLHEFGSDSDDDTFCRSSPYISDDCVSHHSESNSEQWESSGTPEKENHELYDALRGISSVEHTSRSPELGEIANSAIYTDGAINSVYSENGLVQYLSDPLLDLPSLDAFKPVLLQEPKDVSTPKGLHGLRSLDAFEPVLLQEPKDVSTLKDLDGLRCLEAFNPVLLQEPKDVSTPKDFHGLRSLDDFKPVQLQEPKDVSTPKDLQNLRCPGESTPRPPPLPPVEWRLLKPHLDATEENHNVSESFKPVPDTGLWASFTFQQQPLKRLEVNEHPASMKPVLKQQNQQKKEHKGANETAVNSKEIDEKDDFLQQIRTQSFNLRRTVTAKARNTTAGPATHVKVTAILEKANAIRQAVGSDDGDDDDTWSET